MVNAAKDKYNATETVAKNSIHAIRLHKKSNNSNKNDGRQSNDKFIKSCKYCGKGHNTGQCPAEHVKCKSVARKDILLMAVDLPIIT